LALNFAEINLSFSSWHAKCDLKIELKMR
jgi:hypothetical protein